MERKNVSFSLNLLDIRDDKESQSLSLPSTARMKRLQGAKTTRDKLKTLKVFSPRLPHEIAKEKEAMRHVAFGRIPALSSNAFESIVVKLEVALYEISQQEVDAISSVEAVNMDTSSIGDSFAKPDTYSSNNGEDGIWMKHVFLARKVARCMDALHQLGEIPVLANLLSTIEKELHAAIYSRVDYEDSVVASEFSPLPYFVLATRLDTYSKELETDLQNMTDGLRTRVIAQRRLEEILQEKDKELVKLKGSFQRSEDQVKRLERVVSVLEREMEASRVEARAESMRANEMEKVLRRTEDLLQEQQAMDMVWKDRWERANAENMVALKEIQRLRKELEKAVPKEKFQHCRSLLEQERDQHKSAKKALHVLKGTVTQTTAVLEEKTAEVEDLKTQLAAMETKLVDRELALTPRPDWSNVNSYLRDPVTAHRRTTDVASILLKEIESLKDDIGAYRASAAFTYERDDENVAEQKQETIRCLGTDESVPKYLRMRGKVRNRHLGKREIEMFVRDVWSHRLEMMRNKGKEERARMDPGNLARTVSSVERGATIGIKYEKNFEDFFHLYMNKRFGVQKVAIEYAYNVRDALQRFEYDSDCELFLNVLDGHVPESLYHDQLRVLAALKTDLLNIDALQSEHLRGKIDSHDFMLVVERRFPAKSSSAMKALKAAFLKSFADSRVDYRAVFEENKFGDQTDFVELLRDQHLHEFLEYKEALGKSFNALGAPDSLVTFEQLRTAILEVDPEKPETGVFSYLKMGNGGKEVVELSNTIQLETFIHQIFQNVLKRSGKPMEEEEEEGGAHLEGTGFVTQFVEE